jgi:hypothetical protein
MFYGHCRSLSLTKDRRKQAKPKKIGAIGLPHAEIGLLSLPNTNRLVPDSDLCAKRSPSTPFCTLFRFYWARSLRRRPVDNSGRSFGPVFGVVVYCCVASSADQLTAFLPRWVPCGKGRGKRGMVWWGATRETRQTLRTRSVWW